MSRLNVLLLTAAVAITFTACNKPAVGDDALANQIKGKLYSDPATKQANINVAVKDGLVTLTGDAPTSDAALAAVNDTNGVSGVTRVDNQIKVNSAMNQLPEAGNANGQNQPPSNNNPPPSATASAPPPARVRNEPSEPAQVSIPAGEHVRVRTTDTISSAKSQAGDTFPATLESPIMANGREVIPAGTPVTLALVNSKSAGRIKGSAELAIDLQSIEYRHHTYRVDSSTVTEVGKGRGKQTAVRSGIGAAAGAAIGAIAGGGKGAGIGALAGGGAGVGYQLFTHGQQVSIPAESVLTFQLETPLTIR